MDKKILEVNRAVETAKKKHKEGNFAQANEIYKSLINKKIYTYDLLVSYGIFNKEIKNNVLAKKLFIFSIKKYPVFTRAYILLSEILSLENNFKEALKVLLAAEKVKNSDSEIKYNLSILYKKMGLFKESLNAINNALEFSQKIDVYQILKSDVLIDMNENEKAKKLLLSLNLRKKTNLYFHKEILISKIYSNQKNYKKAENVLLSLKALYSNQIVLYLNFSSLYLKSKELNKGISILLESLKIFPDFIPLKSNLALMYRNSGQLDLAIRAHLDIISRDKFNYNSYFELTTIYDFVNHKEQLNELLNIDINNLSQIAKIYICFSKANVYHFKKDYQNSSYFLKIANDEKLKLQPSDLNKKLETGEHYRKLVLDKTSNSRKVVDDSRYLFIVGMPRCGSTLLENILSLNSEVNDMGEVFFLEESLKETEDLNNVREIYKEKVSHSNPLNKIHTDKNLFNFFYCPIICNYFPNAKIIHCVRNPFDNVFSIYKTNFLNQSFSSSLEDITQLYKYHLELMNEYKSKYGSKIYSYDHDKVVQNPEKYIRKLINWLKWEWDQKYLSPQKSVRNVFTASNVQVRKKINSQSTGYWRNYKNLLKPICDSLIRCDSLNG